MICFRQRRLETAMAIEMGDWGTPLTRLDMNYLQEKL